jgi:hypothetical protein
MCRIRMMLIPLLSNLTWRMKVYDYGEEDKKESEMDMDDSTANKVGNGREAWRPSMKIDMSPVHKIRMRRRRANMQHAFGTKGCEE